MNYQIYPCHGIEKKSLVLLPVSFPSVADLKRLSFLQEKFFTTCSLAWASKQLQLLWTFPTSSCSQILGVVLPEYSSLKKAIKISKSENPKEFTM